MKKIFALIILLVFLLTVLCGCGTISRGEQLADQYVNKSIGITFTKPSNWIFYDEVKIAQLMGITVESYNDKNLINSLEVPAIIDFVAVHTTTGNNVILTMERLSLINWGITAEEYLEASKEKIIAQGRIEGLSYSFGEASAVQLGKKDYLFVRAVANDGLRNIVQYLYIRKVGKAMVSITATAMDGSLSYRFEEMFS